MSWNNLQFDPWQVVPRQIFTPYSRLLISTAFVVVSRVGCLGESGVDIGFTEISRVLISSENILLSLQ